MPNRENMWKRLSAELERIPKQMMKDELERIDELVVEGRVSYETARSMRHSVPIRLVYKLNTQ